MLLGASGRWIKLNNNLNQQEAICTEVEDGSLDCTAFDRELRSWIACN